MNPCELLLLFLIWSINVVKEFIVNPDLILPFLLAILVTMKNTDNDDLTMKGGTLGMKLTAGYDLALSDIFGLGFQASLTGGGLSQVRMSMALSHTPKSYLKSKGYSLAHLSSGIGLRFFQSCLKIISYLQQRIFLYYFCRLKKIIEQ
ncbi:MAG: hypothetical protein ACOCWM_04235 [Cyclobacteriaceae bacterium]